MIHLEKLGFLGGFYDRSPFLCRYLRTIFRNFSPDLCYDIGAVKKNH